MRSLKNLYLLSAAALVPSMFDLADAPARRHGFNNQDGSFCLSTSSKEKKASRKRKKVGNHFTPRGSEPLRLYGG